MKGSSTNPTTTPTVAVIDRHLDAFLTNRGIDAILGDYDPHAVLHAPDRVCRGVDEIRDFFEGFLAALPANWQQSFQLKTRKAHGEIGYIVWNLGEAIPLGTDTFLVRDGRIVQQTYAAHVAAG